MSTEANTYYVFAKYCRLAYGDMEDDYHQKSR